MAIKTRYREIQDGFVLQKDELYKKLWDLEPHLAANGTPITWNKAVDFSVFDDHGNKWIDMTSGIFVANAGHANPFIIEAIKKQLDANLLFSYTYPTDIRQKFLSKLLELSPPHFNKALLLNSGSEVMGAAYKLVKLWAKKQHRRYIITFRGSYHGQGLGNDFICGSPEKGDWSGVKDSDVIFLDFPYRANDRFDPKSLRLPSGDQIPADQIAGFFLETFQGWGAWFYPQQYIDSLYAFAKNSGALVCFDEMQAGFYRLGPLYGYMTYGDLQPDIICLGKGITSSLPLSAVLSRAEIIDDKEADLHGTHSGNPLCCAAGLANIEFLSDPNFIAERQRTMNIFQAGLEGLIRFPLVKMVNVRGMIAGLIFHDTDAATRVVMKCIGNGVLPVCTFKHSIKLAPPLTIDAHALYEAIDVVSEAIRSVAIEDETK
ncbi:MAG: aspartate aminotransferase family protein [bacterium]|nr:aspartate aminotransferase family protein [bacterium]